MADKRCENGHFIDESWDLCPYCPADNSEAEIPIVRPTRFGAESATSAPPSLAANPPSGPTSSPASNPLLMSQPGPRPVPVPPPPPIAPPPPIPISSRRDSSSAISTPPMERTIAVQKGLDPNAQPKRYVVGWLVGLNGSTRGESYPVRMGRNVLGRDRRSDVVINDDQASSHHADLVFRPEERRFILMDHNSTNGTYVNESEIEPRRDLGSKDVIRIGSHKFLFMPLCHEGFYWDDEGVLK